MTATGRKKLDELYHPVVERSEFYAMSDMNKPPVLFSPAEDIDKVANIIIIIIIIKKTNHCELVYKFIFISYILLFYLQMLMVIFIF